MNHNPLLGRREYRRTSYDHFAPITTQRRPRNPLSPSHPTSSHSSIPGPRGRGPSGESSNVVQSICTIHHAPWRDRVLAVRRGGRQSDPQPQSQHQFVTFMHTRTAGTRSVWGIIERRTINRYRAPVPNNTAGIVRSKSTRSPNSDQLSM